MVSFTLYLRSVIIAITLSTFAQAAPWPSYIKHSTHNTRFYKRGLTLETYHPKTTYKTYGSAGTGTSAGADLKKTANLVGGESTWHLNESAISFVKSELGVDESNISYNVGWTGTNAQFAYMKQYVNGIPVANAVANIGFNKNAQVISFGSSFVDTPDGTVASPTPSLTLEEALPNIEEALGGKYTGYPTSLEYLAKSDGSLALTHVAHIQDDNELWVEAYIDAHTGELLSVSDFIAHASYNAVPFTRQNFDDGRQVIVDPQDETISLNGWHTRNSTFGPNVQAILDDGSIRATSSGQDYDYDYDKSEPRTLTRQAGAVVNAFYVLNSMHDFSYRYGFTEKAGNFQASNFGKGGRENDPVTVFIQDPSGKNNANFGAGPDGAGGRCRLFLFDTNNPEADSAMSNDIMIHEYTHGITNRMTGGGSGRCLQTVEAGGMGEGWSDMMAAWLGQTSDQVPDYVVGRYVVSGSDGIRSHPYSTSEKTNPLKYGDIKRLNEVHDIGEVWANTLYNVYAALVGERGFFDNAINDTNSDAGNVVFMRLMMDGLLLQPCNPTLLQARDAILQADENRYLGANQCTLWNAFAKKGMGVSASGSFDNGFDVPSGC